MAITGTQGKLTRWSGRITALDRPEEAQQVEESQGAS